MDEEHGAHILALPYPIPGHTAPLSNFCSTLASLAGSLKITLVHTEANLKALEAQQQQQQHHAPAGAAAAENLHLVPISDGLPLDFDRATDYESFLLSVQQMGPAFEALARKQAPSCIVSDPNFCWLPHTAQQLGIPLFLFVTDAAASFAITLHARRLVAEGYIGTGMQEGQQSKVVDFIAGVPALTSEFLPFPNPELVGLFFHLRVAMYDHISQAAGVLLNTFYELEKDVIDGVQTHLGPAMPILPVGPCLPSMPSSRSQLQDSELHCLQWLDAQAPASVVYVAFGSFANVWDEGLYHIVAEGLRRSGQPFLWATGWAPPQAFVQETQEQGLVVRWAPQVHVLAHRAVGAFITHCGWNSTLESIRYGVPMVCMPQFLDQLTNCRLIVDQWKVGVEPCSGTLPHGPRSSSSLLGVSCVMQDDDAAANEVARLVCLVLLDEEGKSLRKRALELCEAACKAVTREVGSSIQSIQKFLSYDALKL